MGEAELLGMLAAETDRRTSTICDGVERLSKSGDADSKLVESLRVEVHGIKGAALMVGQHRLAQIGAWVEDTLADRIDEGVIDNELGSRIVGCVKAIQDGAHAAAEGKDEPSSVGKALADVGA